jgi:predicted dehydrogenase
VVDGEKMMAEQQGSSNHRRTFLKKSAAGALGGAVLTSLNSLPTLHAAGGDVIRVGLIGCGGRGTGAAVNAMRADANMQLVAMCDIFPDRLEHSRKVLQQQAKQQEMAGKVNVTDELCFTGFDGYKQLVNSDIDLVLLCTPPHFRPMQLRAAIEANKHVFCEKPVAVDPTGVRSVLETVEMAKQKDLNLVSGLCWRYDLGVRATMEQIKEGAIGDIQTIQENYLTGTLWHRGRNPEWSEMEYQVRNWLYFTWLSGDHIVEQHIHSLDKALWLMDDQPPKVVFGLGGRQTRTEEKWGHVYDHFSVCYEWENGAKTFAFTRQMSGCSNNVEDYVQGTRGSARILQHSVTGADKSWRYRGPKPSMYDIEHKELFAAIRSGKTINNGTYMSYSTMLAILGREVCYTGKHITWEQAMKSEMDLSPAKYAWGPVEVPGVAEPGKTPFA